MRYDISQVRMNLKSITQFCALAWGNRMVDENRNYYRMAVPTALFWELWRERKDELRAFGINVSKRYDGVFHVCDFSSRKQMNEQEFNRRALKRDQYEFSGIYSVAQSHIEQVEDPQQKEELQQRLSELKTFDEVYLFIKSQGWFA